MAALRGMAYLGHAVRRGRPARGARLGLAGGTMARARRAAARPLEFDLVAYNKMFEDGGILYILCSSATPWRSASSPRPRLYASLCTRTRARAVAAERGRHGRSSGRRGARQLARPRRGRGLPGRAARRKPAKWIWWRRRAGDLSTASFHALGSAGPDKDDKASSFLMMTLY